MKSEAILSDPWIAVALAVFVLAMFAISLAGRRAVPVPAAPDAKLDALAARMDLNEARWKETDHDVRSIKMVVHNLPTKESINAIAVQVAQTTGKMEGMQALLHGLAKSTDRIEDFLLKTSAETIVSVKAAAKQNGD